MGVTKRMLYLMMVMAVIGLIAGSAEASIVLCNDPLAPNPCTSGPDYNIGNLNNPAGELTFVEGETNVALDIFGKFEGGAFEAGGASQAEKDKVTVTELSEELWKIEWADLSNWELRFILVKDGRSDDGTGGCNTNCLYTLFAVTTDQFTTGEGFVYVPSGPEGTGEGARGISHITLFGVNDEQRVPEPMTLALLGIGFLGATVIGRRLQ